jgi:hypothetical protein
MVTWYKCICRNCGLQHSSVNPETELCGVCFTRSRKSDLELKHEQFEERKDRTPGAETSPTGWEY